MKKILFACLLAVLLVAGNALADSITYHLTAPNTALSQYNAGLDGYADLTVNLAGGGTSATITFESNTNTYDGKTYVFLMGGAQVADVNVNATSWTIGTFSSSNTYTNAGPAFTPGPITNGGALQVSEFGFMNQTTDSFDGYNHSSSIISYVLTNTSGTWADAASVLTPNAEDWSAAAHIFVATLANGEVTNTGNTGFAAVPEPTTLMLLGFGLVGLAGVGRKYKK